MNLAPASLDPQLIKGKQLQYCKCLMASIGEGNGNPLQYSCLENPTGGGAW